MLKIAITGNIASGKSYAEKILAQAGFSVLDTDKIAHQLLENDDVRKKIIISFFGMDILEDGKISRPKLGKLVFTNPILKQKIESILHPLIKIEIDKFFKLKENSGEKVVFVAVPLLFEAKFENMFDKILLICADDKTRLKRLLERNPNLSEEDALNKMYAQLPQEEKVKKSDFVIYNDSSLKNFSNEIDLFISKILEH